MGRRIPIRIGMSTATMLDWKSKIVKIWTERRQVAEWRLPFALFVCALLAYAAAFAWDMLASFDLVFLIGHAHADDAFYYFQIAYNLSQGKFSTFDGGVTQTNGYHPVWLLLITPFYWFFDKETALFGIKALEIMLIAGGVALIAVAARAARLAWPLLFAALPILYRYPPELLYGMEAAAAMFALALLILAVCFYMREPERWKWHLAALAFALPWVRIEYIAISLAVTAALCAIGWSRQQRRSLRLSALASIRHAYIPPIGALAGMLAYFAYNRLVFGGILPVSAATKQAWSKAQWAQEGGYNFIENFRYAIRHDAFDYELLIALEICAYLLIAWRLALRSNHRRDWLLVAFLVGVFGLAAGHIAKFAQSVLIMHPKFGYAIWYFVPAYLMTALIIPIRLYVAINLIRRFIAPRRRIAANALSVGVFVIGAMFLIARVGYADPFRWVDKEINSTQIKRDVASYMGAQVMNRALPEGSVIGAWDAGVTGYFSRFPVVNLDGLVNSYDYLDIVRSARFARDEVDISLRYGVTHFANILQYDATPRGIVFESASFDTSGGERRFKIWTYDLASDAHAEIDYSHRVWERMKPYFDYLSDGVGVVLNGRTAQAFAKDCPPDEPLIWTWSEPKHERTVRLETAPYRNSANLCIDAHILPRSAGRPVHAEMRTLSAYVDVDFEDLANRKPIIQSNFNVYLIDDDLIYTKPQCSQADLDARFFASVFPVDPNNLPDSRSDYHGIEFDFYDYGAIDADGKCLAAVDLPNYPIAEIHAGQYVETADGYTHLWVGSYGESAYDADTNPDDIDKFERLADREPIIRSDFDVYIIGDSLIYAKTDCAESDIEPRFYVSISPLYAQSLPDDHVERGYDAIEFNFGDYGAIADDGQCLTSTSLPDYPIAELRTGQYVETADGYDYLWESAYRFE